MADIGHTQVLIHAHTQLKKRELVRVFVADGHNAVDTKEFRRGYPLMRLSLYKGSTVIQVHSYIWKSGYNDVSIESILMMESANN